MEKRYRLRKDEWELIDEYRAENSQTGLEKLGVEVGIMLGKKMVNNFIETSIYVDDYFLFSTTVATRKGKTKVIGYGILKKVYISDKLKNSIKENVK